MQPKPLTSCSMDATLSASGWVSSSPCSRWGALFGIEPVGAVGVFAGLASLASLAFYEHAWNLAGQAPPLS